MAEEITLPRSGAPALVEKDEAGIWEVRTTTCNVLLGYSTDREQAIRNADEDAVKIRAALLPHDALELVARWLWSYSSVPIQHRTECVEGSCWFRDADNLLVALGGQP